ncbi:hypothetical protein TSAR_006359 [Trichomalopsis sarcophagae]|uniref:Uncharacterized protein n=1 Tax=Trichomalopsis sarcophagae TaxID=543379 RepID=A0A232EFF2_9HYME|nr:hypothetical protein TSAR_006359 [Trichomalopsis sarcophagae]
MTFSANTSSYRNIFPQDKTIELNQAVYSGYRQLVQTMLTVDKLDVNFTPNGRDTYLHTAIARRDLAMVQLLVMFKANLNPLLTARDAISPLWMAMLYSYDDISEFLVRAGADINERFSLHFCGKKCNYTINGINGGKTSLLHLAVARNHEAHVKLFLDYGADINYQDTFGKESALQYAVFRKFISLATILIYRGANLESANVDGMTSLHTALIIGDVDLIKMLIQRGANVKAVDNSGKTALHFIAESNVENVEIAEQLLNMGLRINQTEFKRNLGPLHVALLTGKDKLVKLFVRHGADVTAKISNGVSPLSLANLYCSAKTMRLMIARGANVNDKIDDGGTTLHMAARRYSAEKVRVLLRCGANINSLDLRGSTPLGCLENFHSDVAKVLVKQIAIMHARGAFIALSTMEVIWANVPLMEHFNQCLAELKFIEKKPFYLRYTLRTVLDERPMKLAALTRNSDFVLGFQTIKLKLEVPNFAREICIKFMCALLLKYQLSSMEEHLNRIFYDSLPEPIIQAIAYHMNIQDTPYLVERLVRAIRQVQEKARRARRELATEETIGPAQ